MHSLITPLSVQPLWGAVGLREPRFGFWLRGPRASLATKYDDTLHKSDEIRRREVKSEPNARGTQNPPISGWREWSLSPDTPEKTGEK